MRRAVPIVLGIFLLAAARPAAAKFCGDDVAGADVPCDCGDIVVSNLTLADDPVTSTECGGDGLVVRAPEASAGVTVDLNGKTLRGGKRGTAIWVVDGGPGGVRVVSSGGRAAIEGFRDGIVARTAQVVALVENVNVRRCSRDGVSLGGADYQVRAVDVSDAGRDGFALGGRYYRCDGTSAVRSGRFGYFIDGQNGTIGRVQAGNTAEQSGNDGFHIMGSGMRLNLCVATGNRKDGVTLRGAGHEVTACDARGNAHDGISGEGANLAFYANGAEDNGRDGLAVTGGHLVDGGGNSGSGNRGEGLQRPAIQCEIGSAPCQP